LPSDTASQTDQPSFKTTSTVDRSTPRHSSYNKELFTHIHHNTPVARAANANSAFEIFSKKQDTTVFTGYSYKHAWIIAISDDYTAVTWLGHDKPKDIPNKKQTCAKLEKLMKKWVSN